ncbi:MAG: peptidylprolyl isomerase, partial [Methylophilaceae bacterium]
YKIDDSVTPNFESIYNPNQREYVIVRLNKVINEEITEQLSIDIYKDEYVAALKEEIESAFINDLRSEASIKYNPKFKFTD